MPLATDILFYLTGGTGNTDPNASLGGAISTTQVSATALHNLFHYVSPEAATAGEATAGATAPYRAIDVKNTSANTYYAPKIYISSKTHTDCPSISIGYDAAGTQTIVNEYTAPTGITFSSEDAATSKATGVSLGGDMASGATKRIWLRRTITAATGMYTPDTFVLSISGGSSV